MTIKIKLIDNATLKSIAQKIDEQNVKDGKLKEEEIRLFKTAAAEAGFNEYGISMSLKRANNMLAFSGRQISDWWTDNDKVSTDEKDDGQISTKEKIHHFSSGLFGGIIKSVVKNPVESLAIVGGTAVAGAVATKALALTALAPIAGPVVAGALALVGLGFGISAIIKGAKAAKNAKTDGEAKAAWENMGTGTAISGLSILGGVKAGTKIKTKAKANEAVKQPERPTDTNVETTKSAETNLKNMELSQEITEFNNKRGAYTSNEIESIYTNKKTFLVEKGFERTISGKSGSEVEVYTNPNAGNHSLAHNGYSRFSKFEFKYKDGRRVQQTMYNEFGEPAYRELYVYDSNGRLVEVKIAEYSKTNNLFESFRTKNTFKYNEKGQLIEKTDSGTKRNIEYEYNSDGSLSRKITNDGAIEIYENNSLKEIRKHTIERELSHKLEVTENTKYVDGTYINTRVEVRTSAGKNEPYLTKTITTKHLGDGIFEQITESISNTKGKTIEKTQFTNISFAGAQGLI